MGKRATGAGPQTQDRNKGPSSTAPGTHCCRQCGRSETPQWREGPQGPKTLCNACGVKHLRAQKKKRAPAAVGEAAVVPAEQEFHLRHSTRPRALKKARYAGSPPPAPAADCAFLHDIPCIATTHPACPSAGGSAAQRHQHQHHSPASTTATEDIVLLGPANMFQQLDQEAQQEDYKVAQELLDFATLAAGSSSSCAASEESSEPEGFEEEEDEQEEEHEEAKEEGPSVQQDAGGLVSEEESPQPTPLASNRGTEAATAAGPARPLLSSSALEGVEADLRPALTALLPLLSPAEQEHLAQLAAAYREALAVAREAQARAQAARWALHRGALAAWVLPAACPPSSGLDAPGAAAALPDLLPLVLPSAAAAPPPLPPP